MTIHAGSSHQPESDVFHSLLDKDWRNVPLAQEICTRLSEASPGLSIEKQQEITNLCKNCFRSNASPKGNAFALLSFAQILDDRHLITRCFFECFKETHSGGESVNHEISLKEQALQDLFEQIKRCSIKISELGDGSLEIDTSEKFGVDQAECLKKLASFFPNMNLVLGENKDLDILLAFVKDPHVNIHSLNMGVSKSVDDKYLLELSKNLPNLNSFSINSAIITVIPEAITRLSSTINCSNCSGLTTLKALKATTINCSDCYELTTLEAPEATTIDCSACVVLTTLKAPEATTINCNSCSGLTTLEAPEATTINCSACYVLTTLKALKATTIDCSRCVELTTLEALKATTINCRDCIKLTTLEALKATTINCSDCYVLTTLKAPEATTISCSWCIELTTLEVPEAKTIDCIDCRVLITLEAPKAETINCSRCVALTTLEALKATAINCRGCDALTTLKAPEATTINCRDCKRLTTLEALKATTIDCSGCDALTTLEALKATTINCRNCIKLTTLKAPEATTINCRGCDALTTLHLDTLNPQIKGFNLEREGLTLTGLFGSKIGMLKAARSKNLEEFERHFQAIVQRGKNGLNSKNWETLVLQGKFQLRLLKGEPVADFIHPLTDKLADPAMAERVVGEICDFSDWAKAVGCDELSTWLFNLKEEIRLVIARVHEDATDRLLLSEQYKNSRQAQSDSLSEGEPAVNLSLFLDNPSLRAKLRDLYLNVGDLSVEGLTEKLSQALKIQVPILYPENQDRDGFKDKVQSFIQRISGTKDYEIDRKTLDKRIALIVNSICMYGMKTAILKNSSYLKEVLSILHEGADQCENRAAEALQQAEGVYFQKVYKDDKHTLYGIQLMQWKNAFLKEHVLSKTMDEIFGVGQGRNYDVEILLANYHYFNNSLGLNQQIHDVLYLDRIKQELRGQGKSGEVKANAQELFEEIVTQASVERLLDYLCASAQVQKLHGLDSTLIESSEKVRVKASALALAYAEAPEDEKESVEKLKSMFNHYAHLENFVALQASFTEKLVALMALSGDNYDVDKTALAADELGSLFGEVQDIYLKHLIEDHSHGSFRAGVKNDLTETGFFKLPESVDGVLSLNYPKPASIKVDPDTIVEVALNLMCRDVPRELSEGVGGERPAL